MIRHFKRWNKWRKKSLNGPIYKFLVLIGFVKSPTLMFTLTDEEERAINDDYKRIIMETSGKKL